MEEEDEDDRHHHHPHSWAVFHRVSRRSRRSATNCMTASLFFWGAVAVSKLRASRILGRCLFFPPLMTDSVNPSWFATTPSPLHSGHGSSITLSICTLWIELHARVDRAAGRWDGKGSAIAPFRHRHRRSGSQGLREVGAGADADAMCSPSRRRRSSSTVHSGLPLFLPAIMKPETRKKQ